MLRVNRFAAAMDMMAAGTSAPTPMAAYAMPAHQSGNIVSNSTGTMVLPSPPIGLTPKPMATYPSSASTASTSAYSGTAAMLRWTVARLRAASTPVTACGYRNMPRAEPRISVTYPLYPVGGSSRPSAGDGVCAYRCAAAWNIPANPFIVIATTSTAASAVHSSRMSLAMEISAGARSPDRNVHTASSANAAVSGQDPVMPIALSTASIPMSCSATYGMVATIPVSATAPASQRESNLARTNSAGVTNPCA